MNTCWSTHELGLLARNFFPHSLFGHRNLSLTSAPPPMYSPRRDGLAGLRFKILYEKKKYIFSINDKSYKTSLKEKINYK